MAILRINNCKHCYRKAGLNQRNGGWTVDCFYSNPMNALDDNENWCDAWELDPGELFNTPNEAIENWNKVNRVLKVIIAGNKREADRYIRENNLDPIDCRYVYNLDSLRGLRNVEIIHAGRWMDSPLYQKNPEEVAYCLKLIGSVSIK